MSALRRWSGKHITMADGQTMWIRADYLDRMRAGMIAAGHRETGETTVTGGKTYHAFQMSEGAR